METKGKPPERVLKKSRARIASRLVQFRVGAGLNIQQVINATGLSRSGIGKIEDGRASPSVGTVELYVIACGRSLSDFFEPFDSTEFSGSAVAHKNGNGTKRGK